MVYQFYIIFPLLPASADQLFVYNNRDFSKGLPTEPEYPTIVVLVLK